MLLTVPSPWLLFMFLLRSLLVVVESLTCWGACLLCRLGAILQAIHNPPPLSILSTPPSHLVSGPISACLALLSLVDFDWPMYSGGFDWPIKRHGDFHGTVNVFRTENAACECEQFSAAVSACCAVLLVFSHMYHCILQ